MDILRDQLTDNQLTRLVTVEHFNAVREILENDPYNYRSPFDDHLYNTVIKGYAVTQYVTLWSSMGDRKYWINLLKDNNNE